MNYRVVLESAVPVYDVKTPDEAVRIAISKTGNMLNPDLEYVEIETDEDVCSTCGDESAPAFIAADEALVRLNLSMSVFNVDSGEHAERIAQKEIGQNLDNIPLTVVETTEEEGESDSSSTEKAANSANESEHTDTEDTQTDGEDLLPDFDEFKE